MGIVCAPMSVSVRRRMLVTYKKFALLLVICSTMSFFLLQSMMNGDVGFGSPTPDFPDSSLTWRNSRNVKSKEGDPNKLILFWSPSWSRRVSPVKGWDFTERDLTSCEYKCDVTTDKKLVDVSDAVVYHATIYPWWDYYTMDYFGDGRPPRRSQKNWNQKYIFFRIESPKREMEDLKNFDNFFNWTSTYRLDSDIPFRYGRFYPVPERKGTSHISNLHSPERSMVPDRQLVTWMNSHCNTSSKRENFVAELTKVLPVALYGKCTEAGKLNCGIGEECYNQLARKYKFWLSFENSLCLDYLTEKFYMALHVGMVPIVYAHSSIRKLVPEGSYIDVDDFNSVEELANHVKWVGGNETEYLKYFEWRKHLDVEPLVDSGYWCNLCTKVYEDSTRKSYASLHDWWTRSYTGESICIDV